MQTIPTLHTKYNLITIKFTFYYYYLNIGIISIVFPYPKCISILDRKECIVNYFFLITIIKKVNTGCSYILECYLPFISLHGRGFVCLFP